MKPPKVTSRFVFAALLTGVLCTATGLAAAQNASDLRGKPNKDQILRALAPSPSTGAAKTRGLSLTTSEPSASDASAKSAPAAHAAAAAAPQQKAVDLEIPFDYNSDKLTNDGRDVLVQLSEALSSSEMSGVKNVVLEGHTDAKGNPSYNKLLSLRRAQTVKNFIAQNSKVPAAKLKAVGKGSSELADPKNPEDAANRRVRVIVDY
jgi:outer membrane protein OmpA-like peptidoglycan-associated protein